MTIVRIIVSLSSLYRGGGWGTERLSKWPKATQRQNLSPGIPASEYMLLSRTPCSKLPSYAATETAGARQGCWQVIKVHRTSQGRRQVSDVARMVEVAQAWSHSVHADLQLS